MIRTTVTISYGGRRRHLEATYLHREQAWCLQWCNPTESGYRYEPPLPGRYRTKREALDEKRRIGRAS